MFCQACKIKQTEVIEKCDDENQPYELCKECHSRLLNYALRPIEWYNLASIHTYNKFLLHDDFYDDDGTATQPEEEIKNAEDYKAPLLTEIKADIDSLIDYCIAKWWLEKDMVECLKSHNQSLLLQKIKDRFNESGNYFVSERLYEIASRGLGIFSGDWIRERWKLFNGENIIALSQASALCLPFEEGYDLVKNALKSIPDNELPNTAFVCLHMFRTPLTLDWIEDRIKSPVKDAWGILAAASSPSWNKLNEWLEKGRPYSFVAIDTLVKLIPHPGEFILNGLNPRPVLINPPTIDLVSQVLAEYREKDNVPRVNQAVEKILNNMSAIIGE